MLLGVLWKHSNSSTSSLESAEPGWHSKPPGGAVVEDFLSYSLSVQNRRKARAGLAFENHLEEIFQANEIKFDRGKATEGRRKPDFLFPGATEYHDLSFSSEHLTMLAAKTTCKDRWRQVLTEAARIPQKHLCTLEPNISTYQIQEMGDESLTLVAPTTILESYAPPAGADPITLAEFIGLVRQRQSQAP